MIIDGVTAVGFPFGHPAWRLIHATLFREPSQIQRWGGYLALLARLHATFLAWRTSQ